MHMTVTLFIGVISLQESCSTQEDVQRREIILVGITQRTTVLIN